MLVCLGDAGLGRGGRPHIAALVSFGLPCEWNCPDRMHAANIHEEVPHKEKLTLSEAAWIV